MNKQTTNMNKISIILLLLIGIVYIGSTHRYWNPSQYDIIEARMIEESEAHWNTVNKETKDWTNSTQGQNDSMTADELMLSKEPDCIYYDTLEWQKEEDSINAYMRHWYGVLDTNSDGDIDDCGEYITNDSIIEWLEE